MIYYNDNDPKSAAWLRELVRQGCIPFGEVDDRSILDVEPCDLFGFTQCHFFAGIGGWPYALKLAGVSPDTNLWTGSPPCQPFSSAGRREGQKDERHLAPHFLDLVRACRPGLLFGEQVASSQVFGKAAGSTRKRAAEAPQWVWLDDLSDRLEASRYAVGASDIPSAGVGAPHIRQRTFFGAYDLGSADDGVDYPAGTRQIPAGGGEPQEPERRRGVSSLGRESGGVADAERSKRGSSGLQGFRQTDGPQESWKADKPAGVSHGGGMPDADNPRLEGQRRDGGDGHKPGWINTEQDRPSGAGRGAGWTGPTDGFWRDADWLYCRDGKWRPVEPGTFPLAHWVSARVGRLRGYGNAINPWAAKEFIEAFIEVLGDE